MSHSGWPTATVMELELEWNQSVTTPSLFVWLTSLTATTTTALSTNVTGWSETSPSVGSTSGVGDGTEVLLYNWSFIIVMLFVFAGTLGNILVCLAVWLERPLQNVTNWFLVSLAFADLIVSTIVMPFGATAGFLGYWPLGVTWCNVYVTCDVLACSASILHMCCISLGRYLGIRSPLRARGYGGRGGGSSSFLAGGSSKRMVAVRVVLVWLLALLISSPISALGLIDPSNIMIGDQCVINNRGFALFGSLATFYIPMILMVVSYALTVHLLRNKARQHQQQLMLRTGGPSVGSQGSYTTAGGGSIGSGGGGGVRWMGNKRTLHSVSYTAANEDGHHRKTSDLIRDQEEPDHQERGTQTPVSVARERRRLIWKSRISLPSCHCGSSLMSSDSIAGDGQAVRILKASVTTVSRSRKISSERRDLSATVSASSSNAGTNHRRSGSIVSSAPNISSAATVANEQKASKVLGVVFFTFVLCWAPFFLLNLLLVVWPSCGVYIPDRLVATCLWLGYVSSTINPLIYTVFNRTFKRVFIRLLKCQCRKSPAPNLSSSASASTVATVQHRYSRCASVYEGLANQNQSSTTNNTTRYR